jgi:hypothetical protein
MAMALYIYSLGKIDGSGYPKKRSPSFFLIKATPSSKVKVHAVDLFSNARAVLEP